MLKPFDKKEEGDFRSFLQSEDLKIVEEIFADLGFEMTEDWEVFLTRRVERIQDFDFHPPLFSSYMGLLLDYDPRKDYARINSQVFYYGYHDEPYRVLYELIVRRLIFLKYKEEALKDDGDTMLMMDDRFTDHKDPVLLQELNWYLWQCKVPSEALAAWVEENARCFHWKDPDRRYMWDVHCVSYEALCATPRPER